MAKYIIFIYDNESGLAALTPEQNSSVMESHGVFAEKYGASLRGGGRIGPTTDSVTIEGEATRPGHILGDADKVPTGFYIVEADSSDEAVEMAKLVPAPAGGVEVRPLI